MLNFIIDKVSAAILTERILMNWIHLRAQHATTSTKNSGITSGDHSCYIISGILIETKSHQNGEHHTDHKKYCQYMYKNTSSLEYAPIGKLSKKNSLHWRPIV